MEYITPYFPNRKGIVDATIINTPISTKNAEKKRDPEMRQIKIIQITDILMIQNSLALGCQLIQIRETHLAGYIPCRMISQCAHTRFPIIARHSSCDMCASETPALQHAIHK